MRSLINFVWQEHSLVIACGDAFGGWVFTLTFSTNMVWWGYKGCSIIEMGFGARLLSRVVQNELTFSTYSSEPRGREVAMWQEDSWDSPATRQLLVSAHYVKHEQGGGVVCLFSME